MKYSLSSTALLLRGLMVAFVLFALPFSTHAATNTPSCELTVTTTSGTIEIKKKDRVLLPLGEELKIEWDSTNAKKAFDDNNKAIDQDGSATTSPTKTRTYTYRFENGSKKVICEVTAQVVEGAFKDEALTSPSGKPTISGTAAGTKSVQLFIYKNESDKPLFTSKVITVKNGKWSTKVSKSLAKGTYIVELHGLKNIELNTIATSTLSIGIKPSKTTATSDTTFVVETVPLLNGGIAKGGTTVPVSFLQVINIGKSKGKVESFSIKQNGTAATNAIVGFTVTDNRTSEVVRVGSISKPIVFKDGIAVIPMSASIEAQDMRLFTIQAILAANVAPHITKHLKLDVSKVATNGKEMGTFPIRGTTWTLGL